VLLQWHYVSTIYLEEQCFVFWSGRSVSKAFTCCAGLGNSHVGFSRLVTSNCFYNEHGSCLLPEPSGYRLHICIDRCLCRWNSFHLMYLSTAAFDVFKYDKSFWNLFNLFFFFCKKCIISKDVTWKKKLPSLSLSVLFLFKFVQENAFY